MTAPPDDLKSWPKNALIRELRRLRAVLREHATQVPAAHSGGATVDVIGDPHAIGGVIVDARGAVLLDSVEVSLFQTGGDDEGGMSLRLGGRINYSEDHADTVYLTGADGAACIVGEIVALASRAGASQTEHGRRFAVGFRADLDRRMKDETA